MPSLPAYALWLAPFLQFLAASKYPLFFLGSYLEGTVVMLTGGVLLKLGEVHFLPLYGALIAGDVLSDIMWYFIGYFGARPFLLRWGGLINATPAVIEKLERKFQQYHLRILVISKMTMGFGLAVPILTTAGMLRVSFARYFAINFTGSFIWVAFVIYVGYAFGNVLQLVPESYQVGLAALLIIFFFFALRFLNGQLAKVDW